MPKQKFFSDLDTQFWNALDSGDPILVKKFLNKISAQEKKKLFNSGYRGGNYTPLSYLVFKEENKKNLELIKTLVDAGADPGVRDHDTSMIQFHNTALLNAIAAENWQTVSLLIDLYDPARHADYINLASMAEAATNSPLILALKKQTAPFEIIQKLLEKGADPNFKNHASETALHFAAYYGSKKLISSLLKFGADPSIKRHDGILSCELYWFSVDKASHNYLGSHILTEKNNYPEIYVTGDNIDNYSVASKNILNLSSEMNSQIYQLRYYSHNDYPLIAPSVELIVPVNKKYLQNPEPPSEEIYQMLQPKNYDPSAFLNRVNKLDEKFKQQKILLKKHKYYLISPNKDINQLLEYMNDVLIKASDKAPLFQMDSFRLRVGLCESLGEVKETFEMEGEKFINKFFPELKHIFDDLISKKQIMP